MRPRQAGLWIALSLLALTAAACTPQRTQPSRYPVPAVSTPLSPSTTADVRQQALTAYVGMWRAYEQALANDDLQDANLAMYADGSALQLLTKAVRGAAAAKLRGTGTTILSPRVMGASPPGAPTQVSVADCMDTSSTHLVPTDGSPYVDTLGGRRLMLATVKLAAPGTWRVTQFDLRRVGSC
jgi:hypothetical protein